MNKLIALPGLLLLTIFWMGADAQTSQQILDELSRKTKSYTSIYAEYTSRLLDKQSAVDLSQKGVVRVKGQKYNLDLPSYSIVCDGATVWTYEKESNTVYIDNLADMEGDGLNPNEMFRIWEKGFKHELKETKVVGGKTLYFINLYPSDPKGKPYHTVQLQVDKNKMEIAMIRVLNRDSSEVTYQVQLFQPNKEIPETAFRFDKAKFPGVEQVDNRL